MLYNDFAKNCLDCKIQQLFPLVSHSNFHLFPTVDLTSGINSQKSFVKILSKSIDTTYKKIYNIQAVSESYR